MSSVIKNYRTILRHLRRLPTGELSSVAIASQFRAGKGEQDKEKIALLRANAASYAEMISSVEELKVLRGLDTGEKMGPRDTIQASAARVGLHIPRWSDSDLPDQLPAQPMNHPHLSNKNQAAP
jgi:hypothetical protein